MFKQAKSAFIWYHLKFWGRVVLIVLLLSVVFFSQWIYSDVVEYLTLRKKLEYLKMSIHVDIKDRDMILNENLPNLSPLLTIHNGCSHQPYWSFSWQSVLSIYNKLILKLQLKKEQKFRKLQILAESHTFNYFHTIIYLPAVVRGKKINLHFKQMSY